MYVRLKYQQKHTVSGSGTPKFSGPRPPVFACLAITDDLLKRDCLPMNVLIVYDRLILSA